MTITLADLSKKIANAMPGALERPDKRPFEDAVDPNCPECSGSGWKLSQKYDRWFVCPCTTATQNAVDMAAARVRTFDALTSIGLTKADLELDWSSVQAGFSDGFKGVEAVRPAYEQGHGLIFLWGSYGQAKTLIGKVLVSLAYRDGKRAVYANFLEALDNIRQAFDDQEHKTTELIRRIDWWTGRDVLFLDEFDKCNSTPWAEERKFQIVDRCYARAIRGESLTVIASNGSDDTLDGYIRSRLEDRRLGPIVHLEGPDARQVMPDWWTH